MKNKFNYLLVLFFCGFTCTVFANSRLLDSEPKNHANLTEIPTTLKLKFSAPIGDGFIKVQIQINDNWLSLVHVTQNNDVCAYLPALSFGTYVIRWSVLSHDGYLQHGDLTFTIH